MVLSLGMDADGQPSFRCADCGAWVGAARLNLIDARYTTPRTETTAGTLWFMDERGFNGALLMILEEIRICDKRCFDIFYSRK